MNDTDEAPPTEELIESVKPLILRLARRLHRAIVSLRENCELADVEQRAMLATIDAARKHQQQGAFAPFAYAYARGAILTFAGEIALVKIPRVLLRQKLDQYAKIAAPEEEDAFEPAERTPRRTPDLEAAVQDWLRNLPKKQLLAVGLRFGLDGGPELSLEQIGLTLGYEPAAAITGANYLLKRALATGRECVGLRDLFRRADATPARRRTFSHRERS